MVADVLVEDGKEKYVNLKIQGFLVRCGEVERTSQSSEFTDDLGK